MRNILVSAYGCEPFRGSESGVGWNWVLQMAKNNTLHVITRANNRELIENNLPSDIAVNITFHYYDTGKLIKGLKKRDRGLYLYYFIWQMGIIPIVRRLLKEYKFDYTMHLTFGSMWMPTFLPFIKAPFIWGPIGGGEGVPISFFSNLPLSQKIVQSFRYCLKYTSLINPLILIPSIRASCIIVRTFNSAAFIPKKFHNKLKVFLETAIESDILSVNEKIQTGESSAELKLIITGRLVPFKNIISAVRALQYIPSEYKFTLTIIGSGVEKNRILKEIKKLNQTNRVKFIDETTRENVIKELAQSDIYLFPSLREGGSWALMEAMAIGLPVVCLKWSGMEIITDDECAIRLPVTNPDQMPKDMAAAICKLIDNPDLMKKMGAAGRTRIKNEFNWEAKGIFMENLFHELDLKKPISYV